MPEDPYTQSPTRASIAVCVVFLFLGGCKMPVGEALQCSTIETLSRLQRGEAVPVHVSGTVTFYDDQIRKGYLQDETGGAEFELPAATHAPPVGSRISLTGVGSLDDLRRVIAVSAMIQLPNSPQPKGIPISIQDFGDHDCESRLASLKGVVESAIVGRNGWLSLELQTGTGTADVQVSSFAGFDHEGQIGNTVLVTGVVRTVRDLQGVPVHRQVWVQDARGLATLSRGVGIAQLTVREIAELPASRSGERVRLVGRLHLSEHLKSLELVDGSGRVRIRTIASAPVTLGHEVEVIGFVDVDGNRRYVRNAIVRTKSGAPDLVSEGPNVRLKRVRECTPCPTDEQW